MKSIYSTISQQIENDIRFDILSNQLQENAPLREQDLAKKYGVSRGPVCDALKELSKIYQYYG